MQCDDGRYSDNWQHLHVLLHCHVKVYKKRSIEKNDNETLCRVMQRKQRQETWNFFDKYLLFFRAGWRSIVWDWWMSQRINSANDYKSNQNDPLFGMETMGLENEKYEKYDVYRK